MAARRRSFRLTPRAEADLEDIWLYTVNAWSIQQADRYIGDIVGAIENLAAGKATDRPVEIRAGYFKYPIGAHLLFYKTTETGLLIVRILHQRMDVGRHL